MTKTLDYYNENARSFSDQTQNVNFAKTQERFLKLMPPQGSILDFGCGSGRDTKYFLEKMTIWNSNIFLNCESWQDEWCFTELLGISLFVKKYMNSANYKSGHCNIIFKFTFLDNFNHFP